MCIQRTTIMLFRDIPRQNQLEILNSFSQFVGKKTIETLIQAFYTRHASIEINFNYK